MLAEMHFNDFFSVLDEDNKKYEFKFFLHRNIPIVDYSKKGYSFCTDFKEQGWKSEDMPDFGNKRMIFLCQTGDLELDWCSLYHEMGHVVHNHPFTKEDRLGRVEERVVSQAELEADQYVLHEMGRKSTLRWLKNIISILDKEITPREEYKKAGFLKGSGVKVLERLYLSRQEVQLRLEALG